MVSKKNLMEIVKKLMTHMSKAEGTTYRLESNRWMVNLHQDHHFTLRDELLSKIIQICSQNDYQYISNFEWFVQGKRGDFEMSFFQVCVGAGRAQSAGGGRGKAWGNPSSADDGCGNKVCWF